VAGLLDVPRRWVKASKVEKTSGCGLRQGDGELGLIAEPFNQTEPELYDRESLIQLTSLMPAILPVGVDRQPENVICQRLSGGKSW
jgi:hypothetical protein